MDPEGVIREHFREYSWFLGLALEAWRRKNVQAACSYATIAALIATYRHCGFFASPRLERMLIGIGISLPDKTTYSRKSRPAANPQRILHVCSELADIGGHSRMLARMIKADTSRKHSVVLTRDQPDVPAIISEAIASTGGAMRRLDRSPQSYASRALALRKLAREHDLIVLHVHNEDVVPLLAFARLNTVPPVLFINHADHLFWLGSSISDLVVNLRDSGRNLSVLRRGTSPERNNVIPTLVEKTTRKRQASIAKREIGVPVDSITLVSVARTIKYRTFRGVTFADTHVPVLLENPKAHLIVVGADDPADWAPAKAATGGRIVSVPPRRDPTPYFEAADIYVDSYPFVSSTSMMEAAGYALPLVSRFYGPRDAEIVGIDQPGLKAACLMASDDDQYLQILQKLIVDPDYRRRQGALAERAVTELHQLPGWMRFWEDTISKAIALPPLDSTVVFATTADEEPRGGEPDTRMYEAFGLNAPTVQMVRERLGALPLGDRLVRWREVLRAGGFDRRRNSIPYLLPASLQTRLSLARRSRRSN